MSEIAEVQAFLNDFKAKLDVWGIVFRDDRPKNLQTLLTLDITQANRREILKSLNPSDFSEGPISERLHAGSDMWVFGKVVKGKEMYIKITLGLYNREVICISFHVAESKMKYPLKK